MNATDRCPEPQPEPISFSLGTLFLIVSCIGVALVAFWIPEKVDFEAKLALAMILVGAFLALWFSITLQFSRLGIAAMPFVAGVFLLFVSSTRGGPRPVSAKAQCANNLKQIGMALLLYHQEFGSFPPAFVADASGKPLCSWRALILAELGRPDLAPLVHRDEAWDGPSNSKWSHVVLSLFDCPDDPQNAGSLSNLTSYLAVVGPHTAWAGATPRKLSDFKDPSKTILLVEVANSGIHWAEPRDLYVGQMAPGINPKVGQGISSGHLGGDVTVFFADGAVRFLPANTDPKKLAELLDLDGGTTD